VRSREGRLDDYAWLIRAGEPRERRAARMGVSRETTLRYDRIIRDRAAAGQREWARPARLIELELAEACYARALRLGKRHRGAA